VFTPTSDGAKTASLAFTDNASGSPHTIALTGTAVSTGTVTGHVLDGTRAGDPGVAGAAVQICERDPGGAITGPCKYGTTSSSGAYSFNGLEPGSWAMQVAPPSNTLFGGSAQVTVAAGVQTQDFTLTAPQPLPDDFTVVSPLGQSNGGVPTVNWSEPLTISYPAQIPSLPANSALAYFTSIALYSAGDDSAGATPIAAGSLVLLVSSDSQGAVSVAQYPDPQGGANPTVEVNPPSKAGDRLAGDARLTPGDVGRGPRGWGTIQGLGMTQSYQAGTAVTWRP
jgi:hypothetical protein